MNLRNKIVRVLKQIIGFHKKLKLFNARLVWGFTIVELLVAMGIFVILLGIVVNVFISSLRAQRALIALMLTNDNASLALEQMAREIRTGEDFFIPPPPGNSSGSELRFENASGNDVIYSFNSTNQSIDRSSDGGLTYLPVSGANVRITKLNFHLVHLLPAFTGNWPPRITIILEVGSQNAQLQDVFTNIQTTVSARNI